MLNADQVHFKDSNGDFSSISDILSNTSALSIGNGGGRIDLKGMSLTFNGDSIRTDIPSNLVTYGAEVMGVNFFADETYSQRIMIRTDLTNGTAYTLIASDDSIGLYNQTAQAWVGSRTWGEDVVRVTG